MKKPQKLSLARETASRLSLKAETIRQLNGSGLARVIGGLQGPQSIINSGCQSCDPPPPPPPP